MPVRAVIFDFGGVLCFHPQDQQIEDAAKFLGITSEVFLEAFWKHRIEYDAGILAPAEYWSRMARSAGVAFEDAMLPALIRTEINFWSRFDRRMLDWARTLREHGFKTAVLSNLPQPLGEALRATPGFLDPFDYHVFSYELKVVKPELAIYEHTIQITGVSGAESLFLDDRADNVDGARKAGMQAELFTTWEDVIAREMPARYRLPQPGGNIL